MYFLSGEQWEFPQYPNKPKRSNSVLCSDSMPLPSVLIKIYERAITDRFWVYRSILFGCDFFQVKLEIHAVQSPTDLRRINSPSREKTIFFFWSERHQK